MYAVVTRVELPEDWTMEQARQQLEAEVIPQLKQAPGLVAAYFLPPPEGREGLSVVVFDNKQAATAAAENMQPPAPVKLLHVEVREVAASA